MRNQAKAQAARRGRRVIAVHLVLTLAGHWAVNDPRGLGSSDLIDLKFIRAPGKQRPRKRGG